MNSRNACRYRRISRKVRPRRPNAACSTAVCAPLAGLELRGRLGDRPQQRDQEQQPPHRHARERGLGRHGGVGEAEGGRLQDPREVEQQQQAAAEVAERIARRRHAVGLVGPRDVRQQRVVEHRRARHADVAEDEQRGGEDPVALPDERHRGGCRDADEHEPGQQPLANAAEVGDGAENGRDDGDQCDRRGRDCTKAGRRLRRLEARRSVGGVEGREIPR